MLYVCPQCGRWLFSIGLAEAMAQASGAVYSQRCLDCHAVMRCFTSGEKVLLLPEIVDSQDVREVQGER